MIKISDYYEFSDSNGSINFYFLNNICASSKNLVRRNEKNS